MKIEKNKVVALNYELQVEGKIADKSAPGNPLEYIHGTGMLLPKFEEAVQGKEPGDSFAFTLTPEEGYGTYNPEYRFDIPKSSFEVDGQLREDLLKVGNIIPMMNGAGQVVQGSIAAIGEETVTMDFNHPMAGKVLNFSGDVVSVREATEKELTEGLHGEYLPKEGCGGCCGHHGEGGCEGGCEGDCDCEGGHEGCGGHEACGCHKKDNK